MRFPGGSETQRHVLIDGGNLVHRAYHSHVVSRIQSGKTPLSTSSGFETGIVFGFLQMLGSWVHDMGRVSKISVFFDGKPTWRVSVDPTYKSNRVSSSLVSSHPISTRTGFFTSNPVEVLASILPLLGCDVYRDDNEEADDLIASFCSSHPDSNRVVVSDDKDFFQLLTDSRIVVYRPGSPGNRFFDSEAAEAHWAKLNGGSHPPVPPTHVRMFKSLCGDPSDGIRGVDRLRKKVAVTLCHHQTVEDLFSSGLPGFSDSERDKSFESKSRIITNFELVGLRSGLDLSKCVVSGIPDFGTATDIIREDLEMVSLDLSGFRLVYPASLSSISVSSPDWLTKGL